MNRPVQTLALAAVAIGSGCRSHGDTLRVSGTVEIRELQLAPLASGRLARLLKDEGDTVHRADTIAVLEQPGLDALISQRRAQAEAAAARTAEIVAAVADSQRAANDLRRAAPLRVTGIISIQQYENLEAAAAAAAARLQAVRAAHPQGTVWVSDQVPAMGLVKATFPSGQLELLRSGTSGAQDLLRS